MVAVDVDQGWCEAGAEDLDVQKGCCAVQTVEWMMAGKALKSGVEPHCDSEILEIVHW